MKLWLYSLIWWVILPLVLFRLWWLGRKEPDYRRHILERLALQFPSVTEPVIWIHAVSVGETRAAEPLITELLKVYTRHTILLTHMTPTGRETGRQLFADEPNVVQAYLPYDTITMTRRFIAHTKPALCILMETEVWPSLVASCVHFHVPVALVNARLSERSLRRAKKFENLIQAAMRSLSLVAAQSQHDANRLKKIGARKVEISGNMKFDIEPPLYMLEAGAALREQFPDRTVFLCASTREGEERLILDAFVASKSLLPENFLLVIVPRHPQRFDHVAAMTEEHNLNMMRRSQLGIDVLPSEVSVLLGDTMGEMFAYYAACDVAFIGGSLLPLGGQNLIEANACGKPALVGPHTFNFAQVSEAAIHAGAAVRVKDAEALFAKISEMLQSPDMLSHMAEQAIAFVQHDRGATKRTVAALANTVYSKW
jgi:3-deoxy-D-manno-octulosonic-acid transferase